MNSPFGPWFSGRGPVTVPHMRFLPKRRAARLLIIVGLCAAAFAIPNSANAAPREVLTRHDHKTLWNQNPNGQPSNEAGSGKNRTNGISYHGGPVILGTTNVYVIWYGTWPGASTTPAILTNLLSTIGGSPYFNINTTYYNGANTHVSNAVSYRGSATDSYSQGTALTDAGVKNVVATAISTNALPMDTNAVYFVLTSADVSETSGFLSQYCGWHDHGAINGQDVKFSFVGDASANLSACAAQTAKSPNGNPAADAMASVVAHELEEATTDPDLNAWYDGRGYENADKCAWTFGTTYTANGAKANMKLGGKDYLIQRNWVNASGGYCAVKY